MGGVPWSERELRVLEKYYGKICINKLVERVNKSRPKGTPKRTKKSITAKAYRDVDRCPDGMISLFEVRKNCAVNRQTFFYQFKKAVKDFDKDDFTTGRYVFVSPKLAEHMENIFSKMPSHYLSVQEISNGICVADSTTRKLATRYKSIPYLKKGQKIFIPDWVIAASRDYLRKTGFIRVNWHHAISNYAKKGFTFRHKEAQEFLAQRLKSG